MVLTPQQVIEFYEQGYFIFPQLFSLREVKEMQSAAGRLQESSAFLPGGLEQECKGSRFIFTPARDLKRVVWCGAAEPLLNPF